MDQEGFKKLVVWQKSYRLALDVYKASADFPKSELYGLVSQIRRASLSVPANIAEGYERKHRKEYIQYLMVAKGSVSEVETYLLFAQDLGYLSRESYQFLESSRVDVIKLLRALINSLS